MLARAPYEAERAADGHRWPPQRVSESRIKALAALACLDRAPSRGELERLAAEDSDPNVKLAVQELLARSTGG
jgi:hypothetical protein